MIEEIRPAPPKPEMPLSAEEVNMVIWALGYTSGVWLERHKELPESGAALEMRLHDIAMRLGQARP